MEAGGPQNGGLEALVGPARAGACGAAVTWPAVTATDDCSLDTLGTDTASGSTFPGGTSTVTYTATDIFGNVTTAGFTVTVLDDQGPAILGLPSDVVLSSSNSECGSLVSWTSPTASDDCGVSSLTGSHTSGTWCSRIWRVSKRLDQKFVCIKLISSTLLDTYDVKMGSSMVRPLCSSSSVRTPSPVPIRQDQASMTYNMSPSISASNTIHF